MKTKKERQLAVGRGKGMGEEPNHTTARNPVLYKLFNTLCEGWGDVGSSWNQDLDI
jgi:hypothetical protein